MTKSIIINIAGGTLQTIRANFPLEIDSIEIFDEDGGEFLSSQYDMEEEYPSQADIDEYWEEVVVKEFPYVVY